MHSHWCGSFPETLWLKPFLEPPGEEQVSGILLSLSLSIECKRCKRFPLRQNKRGPIRDKDREPGRNLKGHTAPGAHSSRLHLPHGQIRTHRENLRATVRLKEGKSFHLSRVSLSFLVCEMESISPPSLDYEKTKQYGKHTQHACSLQWPGLTARRTGSKIHKWILGLNFLICTMGQTIQVTKTKVTNSSYISSWPWCRLNIMTARGSLWGPR